MPGSLTRRGSGSAEPGQPQIAHPPGAAAPAAAVAPASQGTGLVPVPPAEAPVSTTHLGLPAPHVPLSVPPGRRNAVQVGLRAPAADS